MRIILKILAAPFVVILSILWAMLVFLFSVMSGILQIVCGIGVLLSIVAFIGGQPQTGGVLIVISFLISPLGIPIIAEWLIGKLGDLNCVIKNFITT